MKNSESTEMDRLLRRYSRRQGEALRAAGQEQAEAGASAGGRHLDADEMNAYAEGALPEAARSRYVAHLADCDACRKLVTTLTLAAGVTVKESTRTTVEEASPSKSWREWLGALFSPPVLRYGVPAIVLLSVIVVAFLAMRTQRERQFTAMNERGANQAQETKAAANGNASALTTTDTVAESHANSNMIAGAESQQAPATSSSTTAAPPSVKTLPADEDAPPAPQASPSQTVDQTPGVVARGQEEVLRKDDATKTAAPPPAEAPPPAPKIEGGRDKQDAGKRVTTESDKEKIANQPRPTAGAPTDQSEIAEERKPAAKAETSSDTRSRASRNVFGATTTTPAPNTAGRRESAAETRNVAGRQFRRQGSAWVDTAYNSSRSLTNVARGSEQYRALVADEPQLRTVAEQLSGEVIVVWKSRAYRFH